MPFRNWKVVSGPYRMSGVVGERTYKMYVRNLELNPRLVLKPIEKILESEGTISRVSLGAGSLESFDACDFVQAAICGLRNDHYWPVRG